MGLSPEWQVWQQLLSKSHHVRVYIAYSDFEVIWDGKEKGLQVVILFWKRNKAWLSGCCCCCCWFNFPQLRLFHRSFGVLFWKAVTCQSMEKAREALDDGQKHFKARRVYGMRFFSCQTSPTKIPFKRNSKSEIHLVEIIWNKTPGGPLPVICRVTIPLIGVVYPFIRPLKGAAYN